MDRIHDGCCGFVFTAFGPCKQEANATPVGIINERPGVAAIRESRLGALLGHDDLVHESRFLKHVIFDLNRREQGLHEAFGMLGGAPGLLHCEAQVRVSQLSRLLGSPGPDVPCVPQHLALDWTDRCRDGGIHTILGPGREINGHKPGQCGDAIRGVRSPVMRSGLKNGITHAGVEYGNSTSETGLAYSAGAGWEIKLSRNLFFTPAVDWYWWSYEQRGDDTLYEKLFNVSIAVTWQPGR